ncbi:ComEA family DNA-binding protein [Psychrobacter sp. DM4]|uniref:ComEA family DNA-binding protein n=1 Tax=Psychrobacter sp. DM4 TaxID=3440637 RepID=UPI003F4F4425
MSAASKDATNKSTSVMHFLLLIVCVISALSAQVHAAPCFDNPTKAYRYLLAQEKLAVQTREQKRVNINRASESELTSLKGIGSSKAQAIILYREMFGDFESIDELQKVKGIGAKTIEKNRARLQISE